jgi:hypothetical protein
MRLSEKALRGLKITAAVFITTQTALVEQYVLEGFERHPLPPDLGL